MKSTKADPSRPLQEAAHSNARSKGDRSKQQQQPNAKRGGGGGGSGGGNHNSSKKPPVDENLPNVSRDPRGDDPERRIHKNKKKGRNTESFDPESTMVRPALRVQIGSPNRPVYGKPMRHDDCILVPELFGPEDDWKLYYQLVREITELQNERVRGSEWLSWHEGAHLVVKDPSSSKTFNKVIDRLCEYFQIQRTSVGTRFNWYKDSSDWKPFHHDSA